MGFPRKRTQCYQSRYMDSLGRPVAELFEDGGGSGEDILNANNYDSAGRLWRRWMPVPTLLGNYMTMRQLGLD